MTNNEQITVNGGKQVATGVKKSGEAWAITVYQTSVGECKSFLEIAPETTAVFETEVRNSKPYKGQTKPEKWINKFTGAVEGVKVGHVARPAQVPVSPQVVFTEDDRTMIRETFEMVRALYDEKNPN